MPDLSTHDVPGGCPADASDLLPALLHGRLTGAERVRAESHLAGCDACAAELRLLGAAREAWTTAAPAVDVARIAAAVCTATIPARHPAAPPAQSAAPPSVRRPTRWRVSRAWQAIAATLVLAIGAGAGLFGRGQTGMVVPQVTHADAPPAVVAPGPTPVAPVPVPAASVPSPTVERATTPALLAAAEPALGAGLADLTDAELDAVLAAVRADDGLLPSEESDAVATLVGEPGGR